MRVFIVQVSVEGWVFGVLQFDHQTHGRFGPSVLNLINLQYSQSVNWTNLIVDLNALDEPRAVISHQIRVELTSTMVSGQSFCCMFQGAIRSLLVSLMSCWNSCHSGQVRCWGHRVHQCQG